MLSHLYTCHLTILILSDTCPLMPYCTSLLSQARRGFIQRTPVRHGDVQYWRHLNIKVLQSHVWQERERERHTQWQCWGPTAGRPGQDWSEREREKKKSGGDCFPFQYFHCLYADGVPICFPPPLKWTTVVLCDCMQIRRVCNILSC